MNLQSATRGDKDVIWCCVVIRGWWGSLPFYYPETQCPWHPHP